MKDRHLLFATCGDLQPGLEFIEGRWELEYHWYQMLEDQSFLFLRSLLEFSGLGSSETGDTARDADFFVYPRAKRPRVEAIAQRRGGMRYVLRPSAETVHFRPGGIHAASGALVAGQVARAVTPNARGVALYQDFSKAVLRGFNLVGLFWLGPEAYGDFKNGRRLVTMSIRSPREYDLAEASAAS